MTPGYKTTEFWLTFAAIIVGTLLASGAIGPGTELEKIVSFAATALAAMGYTYSRSMVKATAIPPAGSAVALKAAMAKVTPIALVLLMAIAGCGGTVVPVVTNTVIDCTGDNAAKVAALFADFKAKLSGGGSWALIEADAKSAGVAIGGCALALLVQDYLGGKGAPASGDAHVARSTLEDFRATVAGGATFKTSQGSL